MQLRRHSSSEGLDLTKTKELFENREVKYKAFLESPYGADKTEADAKELFISIVYDAHVPEDSGEFTADFAAEQAQIRKYDAEKHPELMEELREQGKDEASLQAYLNFDEERKCVNMMEAIGHKCGGIKAGSYEHDGIVGFRWDTIVDKVTAAGLEVKVKPIPSSFAELLVLARAEEPTLAWEESVVPFKCDEELKAAKEDMAARALFSLQKGESIDHVAFAKVALSKLGGEFVIEREDKEILIVQWFDWQRRLWVRAGGSRQLEDKTSEVLRTEINEIDDVGEMRRHEASSEMATSSQRWCSKSRPTCRGHTRWASWMATRRGGCSCSPVAV